MARMVLCWLVCLFAFPAGAQQVLSFDAPAWNFGTINEADGKVSHEFVFRNVSSAPVAIEQVKTTCGCTVPAYSKAPVRPGQTGRIKVTFDPTGRTNTFHKSVQVVCKGGKSIHTLYIKGVVRLAIRAEEEYPYVLAGNLRCKQKAVFCGMVRQGAAKDFLVELYNDGDASVCLEGVLVSAERCVQVRFPKSIPPHAGVSAKVTVLPVAGRYGSFSDKLYFLADGKRSPSFVSIQGHVVDGTGRTDANRPIGKLSDVYWGASKKLLQKESLPALRPVLRNDGKSPLKVHAIECPSGVRCGLRVPFELKGGEERTLPLKLAKNCFEGTDEVRVRIFTNDALSPMLEILIEGK